ncbi:MAG TPA: PAS domain-containing protein [Parvibaculum sp.]|jgi:hypothetical protein
MLSQSDQASQSDEARGGVSSLRTADSLAFEEAWFAAKGDAAFPARNAIDLKSFARFASFMAIIEPDPAISSLPFRLSGSGFFDLLGFDLTGLDYLDLVDPAIKDGAYASVMACLSQPCGLWQSTPTEIAGGEMAAFELTIFPISKTGATADHILIFVTREHRPGLGVPTIERVKHSTVWQWIDTGFGLPDITA